MCHRFLGDDGLGFCQLALIVFLHCIVITDGEVGRFNKCPCQIFISVFCVRFTFLFAVTVSGTIDATAVRGILAHFFKNRGQSYFLILILDNLNKWWGSGVELLEIGVKIGVNLIIL